MNTKEKLIAVFKGVAAKDGVDFFYEPKPKSFPMLHGYYSIDEDTNKQTIPKTTQIVYDTNIVSKKVGHPETIHPKRLNVDEIIDFKNNKFFEDNFNKDIFQYDAIEATVFFKEGSPDLKLHTELKTKSKIKVHSLNVREDTTHELSWISRNILREISDRIVTKTNKEKILDFEVKYMLTFGETCYFITKFEAHEIFASIENGNDRKYYLKIEREQKLIDQRLGEYN